MSSFAKGLCNCEEKDLASSDSVSSTESFVEEI